MRMTLAVLALSLLAVTQPAVVPSDPSALETRITIRPVSRDDFQLLRRVKPGMLRCSVEVVQPDQPEQGWAPKDIIIGPGERQEETSDFAPMKISVSMSINQLGSTAHAIVTVMRSGKVVSRQVSNVSLPKATP
jgi:hypothetical protein